MQTEKIEKEDGIRTRPFPVDDDLYEKPFILPHDVDPRVAWFVQECGRGNDPDIRALRTDLVLQVYWVNEFLLDEAQGVLDGPLERLDEYVAGLPSEKLQNIWAYIAKLEADEKALKDYAKKFTSRAKASKNTVLRMKDLIKRVHVNLGRPKIDLPNGTVSKHSVTKKLKVVWRGDPPKAVFREDPGTRSKEVMHLDIEVNEDGLFSMLVDPEDLPIEAALMKAELIFTPDSKKIIERRNRIKELVAKRESPEEKTPDFSELQRLKLPEDVRVVNVEMLKN